MRKRALLPALILLATAPLTACSTPSTPSTPTAPAAPSTHHMPGMTDMTDMPGMTGQGLDSTSAGYTLTLRTPPSGTPSPPSFTITRDGAPVTEFQPEQTKLMHFYLVRSDLTGFQHVHPTMAPDGTWSAPTQPVAPGDYRIYVQFVPRSHPASDLTLSVPVTVPGVATPAELPAPAPSTTVDGYTVTLGGTPRAGDESPLTATVTHAGTGAPVTDLQPYLDTYAHVTAIHQGDLAFAHLHPLGTVNGDHGGPTLSFHAMLPQAGNYRLFVQFQTDNTLHTAALTRTAAQ